MSRTWLICDMGFLAYRAFHVFNGLRHGAAGTGVVFGVLKDVQTLMEQHATRNACFCFDHGKGLREQRTASYKAHRRDKKLTDEEVAAYTDMRAQVKKLRREYLPRLGFKNVFAQKGYEADDVIAAVVNNLPAGDDAVVVSADKDLYQLLSDKVCLWNPTTKVCTTRERFQAEWGVVPWQWPLVKAVAGCPTDGVVGLAGVGEKGAASYAAGTLKDGTKKDKINAFILSDKYKENLDLVTLPYPGVTGFVPEPDEVSPREWRKLADELGMQSIREHAPGARGGFGFKTVKGKEK